MPPGKTTAFLGPPLPHNKVLAEVKAFDVRVFPSKMHRWIFLEKGVGELSVKRKEKPKETMHRHLHGGRALPAGGEVMHVGEDLAVTQHLIL